MERVAKAQLRGHFRHGPVAAPELFIGVGEPQFVAQPGGSFAGGLMKCGAQRGDAHARPARQFFKRPRLFWIVMHGLDELLDLLMESAISFSGQPSRRPPLEQQGLQNRRRATAKGEPFQAQQVEDFRTIRSFVN